MVRLIVCMVAGLFATTAVAQAPTSAADAPISDCRIRANAAPASWIIRGYDPFSAAAAEGTYSVTFINDGTAECVFTPTFELQDPPFGLSKGSGKAVTYEILNLTEAQDVTPRAGRSQRLASRRELVLQPNEVRSMLYKLVAYPGNIIGAGTFTQGVTIEAQDRQFRSFGGTSLVLGLNVLPSARIGLAGAYTVNDGLAVVNLGELKKGVAPLPLQLRVNSTGGYEISVSSANSGRLRLGSSGWSIPYTMTIGNKSANLAGARTVAGPTSAGFRRDILPIEFIIGDVSDKRAGSYTDVVSIAVTAR